MAAIGSNWKFALAVLAPLAAGGCAGSARNFDATQAAAPTAAPSHQPPAQTNPLAMLTGPTIDVPFGGGASLNFKPFMPLATTVSFKLDFQNKDKAPPQTDKPAPVVVAQDKASVKKKPVIALRPVPKPMSVAHLDRQ